MHVALYVRRSTVDLQPDSLAAQEELLRAFAIKNGHTIVRSYQDSASGRFVEGRDAFKELIERVKLDCDFDAILVRDVSRWSRAENTDEAGYYEFICRSHGVQVLYAEETFGPDGSPYSLLLKSVKRAMASEFSRERARMTTFSQMRVVREGFWPIGSVPYGMKRVLVDQTGKALCDLAPGQHKLLSSHRIKLAPGESAHVSVVRGIFEAYAHGHSDLDAIARKLNDEGVTGSKGGRWSPGMVSYVLRNETYAGNLVYRVRRGESASNLRNLEGSTTDRVVRCEGAHEPIIDAGLWRVAQERIRAVSKRLTDTDLQEALNAARARWNIPKSRAGASVTAKDLREGYGLPDVECVGKAASRAVTAIQDELRSRQVVIDKFEAGWLLDHLLHVGFKVSLPHARFGGLHWCFGFTGEEREDVIVGLGFSPPPNVRHVETYLFRGRRLHRPYEARPQVGVSRRTNQYRRVANMEDLVGLLNHSMRFRSKRAEGLFRAALHGQTTVKLTSVAKQLGWPWTTTRTLYRKLEWRGESLPPLANGKSSARVSMTCPHCLRVRFLLPKAALNLDTDVCFECLHRPVLRTPTKLVAVCPRCGAHRLMSPPEVARGSAGLETLCRACSTADGRLKGAAASHAKKRLPR